MGLLITFIIFAAATVAGRNITLGNNFIPSSFFIHTVMLIFSVGAIAILRKYVPFRIAWPRFKTIWKPILFGFLTTVIVNITLNVFTMAAGFKPEAHPLLTASTPLQTFLFIFIYASIAEEILMRGFLQNFLHPLKARGIHLFKHTISLPVIIGAVAFGLIHLILFTTGVGTLFVVRTVIFTTILGLFAGYYQEKHNNHAYAIIVHMAGNLMGVFGALLMH